MNQTGVVGNTFTYTFSTNSEDHLDNHDPECRYPGTGAWAQINSDHGTFSGSHGTVNCP